MLCALNEGKESKCERYYPKFSKGHSINAGDYKITYDRKLHSIYKETSIYQYQVTRGKLAEPFIVTHFLVNSWKDHSIPTNLEQIIAVDYANQAIMANPDFTMVQLLKELRKMRFHAVQGGGQYFYIHAGLIELWVSGGIINRDHCKSFLGGYKKICEILNKKVSENP
ncbi:unnamed protein product, partial [Mesorhabditis belari]|uniref:Tyrosine-protein phosphatase domain-containing protein n=1 Tax=Mesorhabditis belari TaxID=2138241 RepID=A0AAF3EUM1_9BILA